MKLYQIVNNEMLDNMEDVFVNSRKGTIIYKEKKGDVNFLYEIEPIRRLDNAYFVSNKYKEFHGVKISGMCLNPYPKNFKK